MSEPQAPRFAVEPDEPDERPRRSRRRRAAIWGGLALALLAVLLTVAALWLVDTGGGARFAVARVSGMLPGRLTVAEVEGPLRGPLTLRGVRYETESLIVEIDEVKLDWRLRELRRRVIDVDSLVARGVRVRMLPSEVAERRELADINLRYNVVLRSLRVEDMQVFRPGQEKPLVIDRLTLATGEWRDRVTIEDVDVVSPHFDLEASGSLLPTGDYPLELQVVWGYHPPEDVAAGRPPLAGRGTLAGTLRELRVEQRLEKPFAAQISAVLADPLYDLRFRGTAEIDGLDLRWYVADSPVTLASGTVRAEGSGVNSFRGEGKARLATVEWGEVDADFDLARDGGRWRFERLVMRQPGRPGSANWVGTVTVAEAEAEAGKEAPPPALEGRLTWRQLTWPLTGGADPAVRSARGSAVIEGNLDDYMLVVDGAFAFPNVPEGTYDFTAQGDRNGMRVESLRGRVLGGRVAGSGRFRWKPAVSYTVQATGTGLQPHRTWDVVPEALAGGTWRFTGHGDEDDMVIESLRIENERGTLVATGGVGWEPGITWHTDARTTGISPATIFPQVPANLAGGDWHVVGRGTDARADLSLVEGDFLGGRVEAAGAVAWEPRLEWRFAGTGTGLDPALAYPGWPGDLAVTFRTTGEERGGEPAGEVVVERAQGILRGRPLDGHGTVRIAGEVVRLAGVEATWGPGTLSLEGQIAPQLALAYDVRQLDLDAVLPGASGVLAASGTASGELEAPRIDATLSGERLAWRTYRADSLAGRAALDLRPGGTLDADLRATGLKVGEQELETAHVTVAGTRERHDVTATVSGEGVSIALAATGALGGVPEGGEVDPTLLSWTGTLTRLDAEAPQTGSWRLAGPVPMHLEADDVRVERLCWLSGDARLCADVDWQGGEELALAATLEDLPLTLLEPFLPPDVELAGSLDGSARLRTTRSGALLGEAVLRPTPGAAIWDEQRGPEVKLVLAGGEARFSADPSGATGVLDLTFENTGTVRAEAALPGFRIGRPSGEQPLAGRIAVKLDSLAFVEALVQDLGATSGRATADLALSGTLGEPAVRGTWQLADASVGVPRFGLQLEKIQLTATGTGTGPLAIEGTLVSGTGTVTFTGTSPLLPKPGEPLRLEMQGERVEMMDLEEAYVLANPRIELVYDGTLVRVAGLVVVPEARIEYERGQDDEMLRPSRDVVYVGAEVPPPVDPGLEIAARVRIVLGDEVKLEALGLETELEGSLLIVEEPGAATTASGELELVSGTFQAYGQDLVIDSGRLFFAGGPLTDPGIDIRAHRDVPEAGVVAGIHARGTLRAPEVSLWSTPAMSDSQILSYVLLGRPLESARQEEGSMLANAATALGVRGGNMLAEKLAAQFGLEEASIQTGDTLEEAAFVVGKYLSPRLYVSYGIGIFNAVNTLRIRYLLSERLHLQAETGATTAGDALYTIERGSPKPSEIGEHLYHDLPRVRAEELATPRKVPVGAQGEKPPDAEEPVEPVIDPDDEDDHEHEDPN